MNRVITFLLLCCLSAAYAVSPPVPDSTATFTFDAIKYHYTEDWEYSIEVVDRLGVPSGDNVVYQGEMISDGFKKEIDLTKYSLEDMVNLFDIVYGTSSQQNDLTFNVTLGSFVNDSNDVIGIDSTLVTESIDIKTNAKPESNVTVTEPENNSYKIVVGKSTNENWVDHKLSFSVKFADSSAISEKQGVYTMDISIEVVTNE